MKRITVLLMSLFLLSSCVLHPGTRVSVSLFSDSPWEEATGREMWYKVRAFDGESVHTFYLESGEKSFSYDVKRGKCALFAVYPLGTLTPSGGFWEEGRRVYLYPEWGQFVSALLDLAEERPEVVSEVSLSSLLLAEPDLRSLDLEKTMDQVAKGELKAGRLCYNRLYAVPVDGILTGSWISLLSWSDSFSVSSILDENALRLFPGVWYYLNTERDLMLQVILTSSGECRTRLLAPPLWY